MDYDKLQMIVQYPLTFFDSKNNEFEELTLSEFWDDLFWRGTAQAGDGGVWEYGPSGHGHRRPRFDKWDPLVKFQYKGRQYKMKVVEAFNQNIKVGEKVWWMTKEYLDPSVPAPPKEWQYATAIEMTREGDPDILRVWQTYGEPHGSWEWDLQKLGNPMAINQLRFK
jgi:hypothetical protein